MVKGAHGRKMSKSLGNVIDPVDVIRGITLEDLHKLLEKSNLDPKEVAKAKEWQEEDYPIPECGTDALRFALCAYTAHGRDINLDVLRVEGYRRFCNKMWNATKFALNVLGENFKPLEQFKEYAKPYIQQSHPRSDSIRQVLFTCLEVGLLLISPYMPFISEELFQRLPRRTPRCSLSICVTAYPEKKEFPWYIQELEQTMEFVQVIITKTRSMKSDYQLTKQRADVYLRCTDPDTAATLNDYTETVKTLSSSGEVKVLLNEAPPAGCAMQTASEKCEVHMILRSIVDTSKEITKLEQKKEKLDFQQSKLKEKMDVDGYETKVPENVRKSNSEKFSSTETEMQNIEEAIRTFMLVSEEST